MSKNDFSGDGYEFAAGSVKGLRSWLVDEFGRLTGVTHREVWVPGENVSRCVKRATVRCPELKPIATGFDGVGIAPVMLYPTGAQVPRCGEPTCRGGLHAVEPDHTFEPDCECGFWAYDEHAFHGHGPVVGVIDGYGRTTIGTKGFRCEKARIVALSREDEDGEAMTWSLWRRLQELYPAADFFDNYADMINAHQAVLRTWEPAGPDFWTKATSAPQPVDLSSPGFFSHISISNAWGTP